MNLEQARMELRDPPRVGIGSLLAEAFIITLTAFILFLVFA